MLDLGAQRGPLALAPSQRTVGRQCAPASGTHRDPPLDRRAGQFRTAPVQARGRLFDALVTGVASGFALVAAPSSLGASAVFAAVVLRLWVKPSAASTPICSIIPKAPLLALPGLMHLRVACTGLVLGRGRRGNDAGVDNRAGLQPQSLSGEMRVDRLQQRLAQLMPLQQVAEVQDRRLVRDRPTQVQPAEAGADSAS